MKFRTARQYGGRRAFSRSMVKKSLNVLQAHRSFNVLGETVEGMASVPVFDKYPKAQEALVSGTSANTVLLMADLTPFSAFVAEATPSEIRGLLDGFYSEAVKIIDNHGGVVEKYIGDAIVAAFGPPFTGTGRANAEDILSAYSSAQQIIDRSRALFSGELLAKCAVEVGDCFFGFVGPTTHPELTIVGNPLTVLFRLEEVVGAEQIAIREPHFDRIWPRVRPGHFIEELFAPWRVERKPFTLRGVGQDIRVAVVTRHH